MFYRYVDRAGRSIRIVDRTRGIPRITDAIGLFLKGIRSRATDTLKAIKPRGIATGRYVLVKGKLVKLSNGARAMDIWFGKWGEKPDQGEREQHDYFWNLARRGKLNDVDDRIVWEPLRQKYGRDRLPEFKAR